MKMKTETKNRIIRKLPGLYEVYFALKTYLPRQAVFGIGAAARRLGITGKEQYFRLKQFQGIHKGERCFIVGTGPSLAMEDLEQIKNEYSFSVNSIVLSYPDTSWRPTYYAIQDKFGYLKLADAIREADMPYVFNGISDKFMTPVMDIDYIPFPLNLLDHGKATLKHKTLFSADAYQAVYSGHSITYSAMQLAVYMGFRTIILLGIDCDYSKKVNHIKAYSRQEDPNAAYLMMQSYKAAREYADRHGIRILNATRNAKMDVFERVVLEEVI